VPIVSRNFAWARNAARADESMEGSVAAGERNAG
jgi:hypothetical protein